MSQRLRSCVRIRSVLHPCLPDQTVMRYYSKRRNGMCPCSSHVPADEDLSRSLRAYSLMRRWKHSS